MKGFLPFQEQDERLCFRRFSRYRGEWKMSQNVINEENKFFLTKNKFILLMKDLKMKKLFGIPNIIASNRLFLTPFGIFKKLISFISGYNEEESYQ